MNKTNSTPRYVQPERNAKGRLVAKGPLKHGLKIGDDVHRDFEMQGSITADFFAAENDISPEKPIAFSAALIARQLVRIGSYTGPFSVGMLGSLETIDFNTLRAAQTELDSLGEAE